MFIVARGRYAYEDVAAELTGWEPHPTRRAASQLSE